MFDYPFTGFHFLVVFEIFPQVPNDFRFQDVTGLTVDVDLDTYKEGGENRFVHRLPGRNRYSDLVLKRGMTPVSGVTAWCLDSIENFNYQPTNMLISLLNEDHLPVSSWYIANAIPIKYSISEFNAEQGQIVIESMTLRYEYYKTLNLSAAVGAAVGAVADLLGGGASASASISVG
ncbi:phage tail protein [Mucilaginibacter pocheonensis]|uniref:Phage tail-like protein n=1 Tax=Mucilaginibacter pocheonensis TaxID=398050 RepID=A0ABU1TD54_9SPHI|nr:phage tail protein [Mucilaginibacter pocheonensis]MDR6943332.1 phage tail-like protein [Mucilaginibacter pocheonensis]